MIAGGPKRWWAYLEDNRLTCARGHLFEAYSPLLPSFNNTDIAVVRCTAVDARTQIVCDRLLFVLWVRGGGFLAADISREEKRALDRMTTPGDMIRYLQLFKRNEGDPEDLIR